LTPLASLSLVEREHGRTIPLAEVVGLKGARRNLRIVPWPLLMAARPRVIDGGQFASSPAVRRTVRLAPWSGPFASFLRTFSSPLLTIGPFQQKSPNAERILQAAEASP